MDERYSGLTDVPAQSDDFGIDKYIKGLSGFIGTCVTPMTVAIQGDWGTGKTSVMQMVERQLRDQGTIKPGKKPETYANRVWFNTWQYAQFNMDKMLSLSLMENIINLLADDDPKENGAKHVADATLKVVKNLALMMIDAKVGGRAADAVASALPDGKADGSDSANAIRQLKSELQNCIDNKIKNSKGAIDRIIVFIDDLDRLQPEKAVEFLESMKVFLDCKNCVFVLAIDYGVVVRGIRAKYGSDMDAEKGRSFFDKIIQVPFSVPVANYDIGNYIRECFRQIGIAGIGDDDLEQYKTLITNSIGTNPRTMKRIFNSFLLLKNIAGDTQLSDDRSKLILFALICMQSRFEGVYNYMIQNRESLDGAKLKELMKGSDIGEAEETGECGDTVSSAAMLREQFTPAGSDAPDERALAKYAAFAGSFYRLIDCNGDGNVSEDELNSLKRIMVLSTTTSATVNVEGMSDTERKKRGFWQKFVEYIDDGFKNEFTNRSWKPGGNGNYLTLNLGASGMNIDLHFNTGGSMDVSFWFSKDNERSNAQFGLIKKNLAEITEQLGASNPGRFAEPEIWEMKTGCSIAVKRCIDAEDSALRNEYFKWIVDAVHSMKKVLEPYYKCLIRKAQP